MESKDLEHWSLAPPPVSSISVKENLGRLLESATVGFRPHETSPTSCTASPRCHVLLMLGGQG